jgi:uncharacterized protein YndB with AHSA1/START domain
MLHIVAGKEIESEVTFRREFDVPVQVAFNAWVNEKQVAEWWGPYGFTNPVCRWNARENGLIYVDMTSADGMVFPMKGRFYTIEFPVKLAFTTQAFEDEQGDAGLVVLNTVCFSDEDSKTRISLIITVIKATTIVKESLYGMRQGWSQSLDKLEALLSKRTQGY